MRSTPIDAVLLLASMIWTPASRADIVCPDSSYAVVTFDQVFTGGYRNGLPRDILTTSPNTTGETFASNGISIRVYLKNCNGAPLIGVPPQEIVLFDNNLCMCPGGNIADAATDQNGCTTFSRSIRAGGCTVRGATRRPLQVYADGVPISTLQVFLNNPDNGVGSPCFVDGGDVSGLAFVLGRRDHYDVCFDWNEDGYTDAGDLSYFASELGAYCNN